MLAENLVVMALIAVLSLVLLVFLFFSVRNARGKESSLLGLLASIFFILCIVSTAFGTVYAVTLKSGFLLGALALLFWILLILIWLVNIYESVVLLRLIRRKYHS